MSYFLVPLTSRYMGCEGTTKEYDQNFTRLIKANSERDAKFDALSRENPQIDSDLINEVCGATDFTAIDNDDLIKICDIHEKKYDDGLVTEPLFIEDLRCETFTGDPVELRIVSVMVDGNETKVFIPKDTSLLRTRQEMIEAGLIKEGEHLYVLSANVCVGSFCSETIDKTFDVYQMAESIKDAEYKAVLKLCQETNEEDIADRTDENGEWEAADESGAYIVEGCFQMVEVTINIEGKDFTIFTPQPNEYLFLRDHHYEIALY